jgi:hypothetical protein
MTDEEIIEMAKQAGAKQLMSPTKYENLGLLGSDTIITFARLIAAKQRADYTTDELLDELKRRMNKND